MQLFKLCTFHTEIRNVLLELLSDDLRYLLGIAVWQHSLKKNVVLVQHELNILLEKQKNAVMEYKGRSNISTCPTSLLKSKR